MSKNFKSLIFAYEEFLIFNEIGQITNERGVVTCTVQWKMNGSIGWFVGCVRDTVELIARKRIQSQCHPPENKMLYIRFIHPDLTINRARLSVGG